MPKFPRRYLVRPYPLVRPAPRASHFGTSRCRFPRSHHPLLLCYDEIGRKSSEISANRNGTRVGRVHHNLVVSGIIGLYRSCKDGGPACFAATSASDDGRSCTGAAEQNLSKELLPRTRSIPSKTPAISLDSCRVNGPAIEPSANLRKSGRALTSDERFLRLSGTSHRTKIQLSPGMIVGARGSSEAAKCSSNFCTAYRTTAACTCFPAQRKCEFPPFPATRL